MSFWVLKPTVPAFPRRAGEVAKKSLASLVLYWEEFGDAGSFSLLALDLLLTIFIHFSYENLIPPHPPPANA